MARFVPTSRPLRALLGLLVTGLVLLNTVAFFHAWRFTHFSTAASGPARPASPETLSRAQKLALLLTGVEIAKPRLAGAPDFPYQTLHLPGPNGMLAAWISEPAPAAGPARGTVALFHGYTSDKSRLLSEAGYFRALGYRVLLVDFAGNGASEGRRCTVGYYEAADVKAVVDSLMHRFPGQPLVLYGVSMGAVAILRAESELGVTATANVVECPYGSMVQTAENRFRAVGVPAFPLARLLVFWGGVQNGFWPFAHDTRRYARRVRIPTLLLWGTADRRVTRAETDSIFANLAGPKLRHDFTGCGHEPYWHRRPREWQSVIASFLEKPQQRQPQHLTTLRGQVFEDQASHYVTQTPAGTRLVKGPVRPRAAFHLTLSTFKITPTWAR